MKYYSVLYIASMLYQLAWNGAVSEVLSIHPVLIKSERNTREPTEKTYFLVNPFAQHDTDFWIFVTLSLSKGVLLFF